eukprot:TRINITY_DN7584_c0_g1_i4.p1 TRINITY_DN7584_c0_g1~~TRINITY_DN7584_c0_g1_i4.p1  ORF type:complete len:323 (-),score=104.04 TRINITY_DN7584_c0_g1_i4:131-1099(-)
MGFSSMPIPREEILKIAISIATETQAKPRVIALVGRRSPKEKEPKKEITTKSESLKSDGRLLEAAGAPYGKLFSEMSCIVVHGGLGTTAEALRVGVPVMVTGVLLMDQRFWGQRVHQLGVGPPPVHITNFHSVCVKYMDEALAKDSPWAARAKEVAEEMSKELTKRSTDDGVEINVEIVEDLCKGLQPYDGSKRKKVKKAKLDNGGGEEEEEDDEDSLEKDSIFDEREGADTEKLSEQKSAESETGITSENEKVKTVRSGRNKFTTVPRALTLSSAEGRDGSEEGARSPRSSKENEPKSPRSSRGQISLLLKSRAPDSSSLT